MNPESDLFPLRDPGDDYMDSDPNISFITNGNQSGSCCNTTVVDDMPMDDGPKPMPLYAQGLIIVMYSTVCVVAIGGNVIVCYIVLAYQRMRTVTNYFIVNLACSDILVSALCIPFTFIANLLVAYWPFGRVMCPLVSYAQVVTVLLSAFTLVAISVDRFRAIVCPLKPKMTTTQAMLIIALIWVCSLSVPLPIAVLSHLDQKPDLQNVIRDHCVEDWPGGALPRTIYSFAIMALQYFVPLFVLAFTYSYIGVIIWVKKPPGEAQNNRDQRMAASKRKMVKMMITVVIIYGLCWLPLHTITIIGDVHPSIWNYKYIQPIWIGSHWLAMSNCCYNPMVYCWMNSRFRNGFKHVLRFCPNAASREEANGDSVIYRSKNQYTCVYTTKENSVNLHGGGCGDSGGKNRYRAFQSRGGFAEPGSTHSTSSIEGNADKTANGFRNSFKPLQIPDSYQNS